ncbi:NAD(P)H-binding protein [Secundilactobacillus kimchicus]|uniref:NAD-dependent epimerase dehydratase n=1 Tax=Secundilactobacillus kimchicus JCM 15530 TaxID=1302272 RepID=A0A0R1HMW2_9LACO|nr:NAD(P)H-binding protein [Secundilactobacillus kimchicus]KRK47852.1 NAD-dependent epimerase dehydratase [Secundilactobacillus kimchicus JCM 15530]MBT9671547.1 NAD(P)H-binding protein [Secundilactobacillus kimchicus]
MTKVLILGANGATARIVTQRLIDETNDDIVLYLRSASRLSEFNQYTQVTVIEGDVLDTVTLVQAMVGVDLVYSNIGGVDLGKATQVILDAMKVSDPKRLIFYSALGALHEVPGAFGEWNENAIKAYLPGFREANQLIEAVPEITTTQLRPAWLTDADEINYELTGSDELFKGTEVSRKSVADFVVSLIKDPSQYQNDSIGLDKPGTDGPKPTFMA